MPFEGGVRLAREGQGTRSNWLSGLGPGTGRGSSATKTRRGGCCLHYIANVMIRPMVAPDIAIIVIQPRMFVARLFIHRPIIFLLFVASMIRSIRNGVETPCTIPA